MKIDIDAYYRKYGPMVFRRCSFLLRDEEAAMDAMQDTFVKLIRYQGRLKHQAPSSLLYTMATNVCLNKMRSEKRRPTPDGDLERIASLDDHTERIMAGHILDRVFASQKPDTRTIATLHYVDGLTLQETSAVSGLSVSGVRKRLRRLKEDGLAMEEMKL